MTSRTALAKGLTPLTALALALTAALIAALWGGWAAGAISLAIVAVAAALGRLKAVGLVLLSLLPLALSSLLINALLPAGGAGVITALLALVRLTGVTLPLSLLFLAVPADRLVADLEAHGLGRRAAFVLAASLGSVSRARTRAVHVIEAQRSRGLDTEGSWWRRTRGVLPLVSPLVLGSLAEVEGRALALEVRAFNRSGSRTVLEPPVAAGWERVLRRTLVAAAAAAVVLRLVWR